MLSTALSASLFGLHADLVRVEVDAARGVPSFELVGLADGAVRESRVRVKSALAQVGVDISEYRIVVNLAPADVRKAGSGFDLAIATATLIAVGAVPSGPLAGALFLGELSLTGRVHPVRGVLPTLLGARSRGVERAVVPASNEGEAGVVHGIDVRIVETLADLLRALRGEDELARAVAETPAPAVDRVEDLSDVRGQPSARRALEIAAAGGHNLVMIGPPGGGKTMLARRLPGLLPELTFEEALEVAAVHSVAGLLSPSRRLALTRPFRSPHHTVSEYGLVGGGEQARPGEVSLAHHGVLFLDELGEFRRAALESLRQPLEDGAVTISRALGRATYPARPLLVGAMNPCPCGYLGDPSGRCACTPDRIRMYRGRLSGPLLDRIDVHVALPPVAVTALQSGIAGDTTDQVRARVDVARAVQRARQARGDTTCVTNSMLNGRELERVAALGDAGARLLASAVSRLGLSARAYGKVVRVARTIADLDGATAVRPDHVAEAIGLRLLDRALPVHAA